MIKYIVVLSLLFTGSSVSFGQTSDWSDAYSRRDFKLGMTLNSFKSIKHPDQEQWPNASAVCSNEREKDDVFLSDLKRFSDDPRAKHGVFMCEHVWRYTGSKHLSTAGLMMGNTPSTTTYYFKPPNPGDEPVLYHITTIGPSSDFSYIFNAFQEAYGQPNDISEHQVQNGLGNTFTNQTATYQNRSSKIILKRFGKNLKLFKIDHILSDIMDEVKQLVDKTEGRAADRL